MIQGAYCMTVVCALFFTQCTMLRKLLISIFISSAVLATAATPQSAAGRLLAEGAVKSVTSAEEWSLGQGVRESDVAVIKPDGYPARLYIVEADLTNQAVKLQVATPGDTCVATGNSRATLTEMHRCLSERGRKAVALVNGDFWDVKTQDVRGPLHRRGQVVKNHFCYRPRFWQQALSFIGVMDNGDIAIADTLAYSGAAPRLKEATGAGIIVLRNGEVPVTPQKKLDPRTFIGSTSRGGVVIITADGRDEKGSAGLTYAEMGAIMRALGCYQAVNLDGGGSAQFFSARPDGTAAIRNHPTDGKERPVVNAWMITIEN